MTNMPGEGGGGGGGLFCFNLNLFFLSLQLHSNPFKVVGFLLQSSNFSTAAFFIATTSMTYFINTRFMAYLYYTLKYFIWIYFINTRFMAYLYYTLKYFLPVNFRAHVCTLRAHVFIDSDMFVCSLRENTYICALRANFLSIPSTQL